MKIILTFLIGLILPISAVQADSYGKLDSPVTTAGICPVEKLKGSLASSITGFKANLYKNQTFQLSARYCLLDRSEGEKHGVSFSSSADYTKMADAYKAAYKEFSNVEDKAAFVDHFLYEVSRQYVVLSARPDSENEADAAVVFSFTNKNGRTVYVRFRLMMNESDEDMEQILAELNRFDFSSAVNNTVKEAVDVILEAAPLSISLAYQSYGLFPWRDDPSEELEDFDDPFWDWAWEQGSETCDMMGCDLEWKYDDYHDESYLLFSIYDEENAYYEEWTGYYNSGRP